MSSTTHGHHHPERFHSSMRVSLISVAANLTLTISQIIIGIIGHSQALVADGFHTLSDLIADIIVLFALVHGRKGADEDHPYGHARIETAVTLILGIILFVVAIGIAVNAGIKLLHTSIYVAPSMLTLWIALGTLAVKEGMYRYTMHVATRFNSNMLRASAWHHRSDALSSLVVLLGIGGSLIGFTYLDALAAVVVAIMIIKIGAQLSWQALRELVDTGLSHEDIVAIREEIMNVDGVKALHMLRTRRVGGGVLADVHIVVDDRLSVSEGHQIGESVRTKLIDNDSFEDVTVHIDTEDDAVDTSNKILPLREEILRRLENYFSNIAEAGQIERTTLHYTNGRIVVELILPMSVASTDTAARALARRFGEAAAGDEDIQSISVLFR